MIAVLIGNPGAGARVTIDTQELAWIISREADHVTAAELADWLIAGREDYRLLDLRGEKDYAEYNIPSSENVPLATLIDTPLLRNEKLVLYGEGGVHAAQAWMLLAARGYKHVYMLKGGLDEWQDQILFPRLADSASAVQKAAFEKVKQISRPGWALGREPEGDESGTKDSISVLTKNSELVGDIRARGPGPPGRGTGRASAGEQGAIG